MEEVIKQHSLLFVTYLITNYESTAFWDGKKQVNIDRWRNKNNYSINKSTEQIFEEYAKTK